MKVGLQIGVFTWPGGPEAIAPTLARIVREADDAGFDSIWVMDHFFQIRVNGRVEEPMLEGMTTLGFMAAHSQRARLGLMVGGVHYRHPGLWVKATTTLDVLSGGRAWLGIGAAWNAEESRALAFPFPPLGERFELLEETLQIVRQMWSDDDGPFEGKHFQLAETINSPQPLRRPRPPIMIGGGGERKTLRLVAKYADACNVFAAQSAGPDAVAHKLDVLRQWCETEGRPYDEIRRTVLYQGPVGPDRAAADAFVEEMRALADVGVQEVHVIPLKGDPVAFVRSLGEHVVPALSQL
jgi:F420-dependent oxidoreductase-like protein